jgi:hypothetical protein
MTKCMWIFIVIMGLVLCCLPSSCTEKRTAVSYEEHAERLKKTFESVLFTLPPVKQRHYAVRLYRVTGDKRYIYPIIFDLFVTLRSLQCDERGPYDPEYVSLGKVYASDNEFMETIDQGAMYPFQPWGEEMAFYRRLCRNMNKLRQYNLMYSKFYPAADKMVEALRAQKDKLSAFLLDRELMKTSGAQLSNYVYYLYHLNVMDLRRAYLDGLEEVLMRELKDSALSDPQYNDKIYALTHVILAASDYYQQYVDRREFIWILDYFEQNINTILTRTKPDVYAEVGLCFLLAKDKNSRALEKIKSAVASNIDAEKGMIPSVKGSDDLSKGEHRNVLAIMLLDWPEVLFQGPDLKNMPEFQNLLPIEEQDREWISG